MGVNLEKDRFGETAPIVEGAAALGPKGAETDASEAERNTIFDRLVRVDGEVAGLVAYSIYKQNKRAWLQDFQRLVGRPPTDAEARSYIIGESTERRLATYRHLAAATLAGDGPETTVSAPAKRLGANQSKAFYLIWASVLLVALALLALALRSGLSLGG